MLTDGRGPSFGHQYLSVVLRQVHHIADASIGQVDAVDDLSQLLGQPNLHTLSISTTIDAPYNSAVGMKGLCRLFWFRGLEFRCATPL
jgi:hypothetical protein